MSKSAKILLLSAVIAAQFLTAVISAEPPDLTKTNAVDRTRTYNLGPTGLRGWIHISADGAPLGRLTDRSRQILVTHVGTNTPAYGVIKTNDVILGVGDTLFSEDARKSLGRAITEAEKPENKGILKVLVFRAGQTQKVPLQLRVIGSYSDTAPYNCPKSERILADALSILRQEPLQKNWAGAVSGLALLAAGDKTDLPKLQAFTRALQPGKLNSDACDPWAWGYWNLFLTEYYLITGDKEVLPAIQEYTVNLAKAQSCFGTFGHHGSERRADGGLHGSIGGYGPVNPAGLIANIAIVMGKKCGIKDPEIDPAIERANRFFGYFVNKGCIPYGEHIPGAESHESNGKVAMTSVFFAIQNGHPMAARFFEKMATAAYDNREYGHTGQGFLHIWGVPGANIGGPAAAAAYVKQIQWQLDLARRPDGSFVYDGGRGWGPGVTDDNTYWGRSSYQWLSPTASYLLSYAVSRRNLVITGRESKKDQWLSQQDVVAAVASARFEQERRKKTPAELIKAFEDWSPAVRTLAAGELASRPEARKMEPELLKMAEGRNPFVQECACDTVATFRSTNAIPVFMRLLRSDNRWLRYKAAIAIGWLGPAARPLLPELLKIMTDNAEPALPMSPADPVQLAQSQLSWAIFQGILQKRFNNVDQNLLYSAIRVGSKLPTGSARANLRDGIKNSLSEADVRALAPELLAAISEPAPADRMFSGEIRMGALTTLVKYRFREAIPLCTKLNNDVSLSMLASFGTAAQDQLPEIRQRLKEVDAMYNYYRGLCRPMSDMYKKYIKAIESATTEPVMKSLTEPAQPVVKPSGPNANLPAIVPMTMRRKPGATPGSYTLVVAQMEGNWSPVETSPKPKAIDWSLPDGGMEAGRYTVTFQYTAGKSRYQIHQVEIVQNGKVVAQDKHEGIAGNKESKDTVYHLDLSKPATKSLILRATVSTNAGNNSAGRIIVEKIP